jgi:hypothetical protein
MTPNGTSIAAVVIGIRRPVLGSAVSVTTVPLASDRRPISYRDHDHDDHAQDSGLTAYIVDRVPRTLQDHERQICDIGDDDRYDQVCRVQKSPLSSSPTGKGPVS